MKYLKKFENIEPFDEDDWDEEEFDNNQPLLTNDEYMELITRYVNILDFADGDLRKGQSYMIALSRIRFDIYEEILGTEYDCFYDDKKVMKFLRHLN